MNNSALKGSDLSFSYQSGSRQILNKFSITLNQGEIIGLNAPSGFGKTTLCRILAGYENPALGAVTIDNKPIKSYKGYSPVQMIFQHPELVINPRLKMKKNLQEAGELDTDIISGLGIEKNWLLRYPNELSGGELQRFCIARALGEKTKFILADEISTMLDLITQAQIWQFLINYSKKRNLGILIVSHNEELLKKLCTKIIDMNKPPLVLA